MKRSLIVKFALLVIFLYSCGPSPEEIATQTALAGTTTAESWTATPKPTATTTPTPFGGGYGEVFFGTRKGLINSWDIDSGMINNISNEPITGSEQFETISPDVTKIALVDISADTLSIMDIDGSNKVQLFEGDYCKGMSTTISDVTFSHDGKSVAFTYGGFETFGATEIDDCEQLGVHLVDTNGKNALHFPGIEGSIYWSLDDTKIAVIMEKPLDPSSGNVYLIDVTSAQDPVQIANMLNESAYSLDWSPDSTQIAVLAADGVWIVNVNEKDDEPENIYSFSKYEFSARDGYITWSHDGPQLALRLPEKSGPTHLYLLSKNGKDSEFTELCRQGFSPTYTGNPIWSPDGANLAFKQSCKNDQGGGIYLETSGIYVWDMTVSDFKILDLIEEEIDANFIAWPK